MAFEDLKEKQRVIWGAGPFERVEPNLGDMHAAVVERAARQPGERLLDIGCGTGGATEDGTRQHRPYLIAYGTRR